MLRRSLELEISSDSTATLEIDQETVGDVAGVVWDGALVAVKYFEEQNMRNPGCFNGKKIVELGSGTGVCSMALACLGADVIATDLPEHMELIRQNMKINEKLFKGSATAQSLRWGTDDSSTVGNTDMILIVDCLYYEESLEPLISSLLSLTENGAKITCIYEKRDIGKPVEVQRRFLELAQESFVISPVPKEELHDDYQSSDIPVLIMTRK